VKRARKNSRRQATTAEKQQILHELKGLYQSMSPEYVSKGIELWTMLGLPKELATKVGTMESFLAAAIEANDLTLEDIEKSRDFVAQIQRDPNRVFKPALREAVKKLSRLRRGGRPRLVKTERERQDLLDEVYQLVRDADLSIGEAEQRVCLKHGLRQRTLRRIRSEMKKGSSFDGELK